MKKQRKYIKCKLLLFMASLLLLWCCAREAGFSNDPTEGSVNVSFHAQLPAQLVSPKSYALSAVDENYIKEIDILEFKDSGSGLKLSKRIKATDITGSGTESNQKTFKGALTTGTFVYVFLANSSSVLDGLSLSYDASMSKDTVMDLLVFQHAGKWKSTSSSDFSPIPMWAETKDPVTITNNTTSLAGLSFMRSLLRVDVKVDLGVQGKFKIEEVQVRNSNAKGYVAPLSSNYSWDTTDATKLNVNKASVPSSASSGAPLVYTDATTANISFDHSIYLFESGKQSQTLNNTCLIIGGSYNNGAKTYYRVDFLKDGVHMDLLRNHLYTFNITDVKAAGYSSADDAFNAGATNRMVSEILDWNQMALDNVDFDGQYWLGLSSVEVKTSQLAKTLALSVQTNAIGGWKAKTVNADGSADVNYSWLALSKTSG
ncbi:hypothetical protein CMT37_17690, partial [Elizabethkingia anophelis]|nr:hypothetical protein [Elizabethkingia anophelis]